MRKPPRVYVARQWDSIGVPLQSAAAVALAFVAWLNFADIVTTHAALSHLGATESNPLASALLNGGWVGEIKAALLAGIGYRIYTETVRLGFTLALWFAAGFYTLTVVSNLLVLQHG